MPIDTITDSIPNSKIQISNDESLTQAGFFWRERNGVKVLVCRALEEKGFVNGFSTRLGGVSAFPKGDLNLSGFDQDTGYNIYENRRRFLNVFDGDFLLATVWQVHGKEIKILRDESELLLDDEKADALISNISKVLVGVKTADCVPVLLGDAKTKTFAAVHAGWRGTADSIVVKTIEKMRELFETDARNLICAIGAAASGKNYEVGEDVINAFNENFSTCGNLFHKTRENHALIDLPLANREQLLSIGVAPENIFTAPLCTMERTDLFFSYRVEKNLHGKTGRLMSVIGLKQS